MKNQIQMLYPIPSYRTPASCPTWGDRLTRACELFTIGICWGMLLALLLAIFYAAGCAAAGNSKLETRNSKQTVAQIQAQAKIDVATADAKNHVNDTKAGSPVTHPIDSTNKTVKELQVPLKIVATIAAIAFAVGVGLYLTPLSWLSTILVPVTGATAALCYFGAIALPFFPWVLGAAAVIVIGLLIYEWIHYKSLPAAISAVESDLDPASSPSASSGQAKPASGSATPAASSTATVSAGTIANPQPTTNNSLLSELESGIGSKLQPIVTEVESLVKKV